MGATVITRVVVAIVGAGVDGTVVAVAVGVGVGVGVGLGVSGTGAGVATLLVAVSGVTGMGPMSNPHSAAALAMLVRSPSCAASIACAIFPGPPRVSNRHCWSARSCGSISIIGGARFHSSSVRHAVVTVATAVLAAVALPALSASSSMPAVMTSWGSTTANAARTQSDVSRLIGSGPVM